MVYKMEKELLVHYLGVSSFIFSCPNGDKVGMDFWTPHAFKYAADVPADSGVTDGTILTKLLISHDHKDHCYIPKNASVINGVIDGKVKDGEEILHLPDINVRKYTSDHFPKSWLMPPKANTVFLFDFHGIKICDLADSFGTLANLSECQALKEKLGDVNVLMLPIDGANTKPLELSGLFSDIAIFKPSIIIPMHYYDNKDKEEFLKAAVAKGFKVINKDGSYSLSNSNNLGPGNITVVNITPKPFK